MNSAKLFVGTAMLALITWIAAPAATAAEVAARLALSCNQSLVNCIDQATETFDCCAAAADPTTEGLLEEYCPEEPLRDAEAPAAPAGSSSVGACLLAFNATTTACNVAYAICLVTNPAGSPAK
jgi:hypothetical protein